MNCYGTLGNSINTSPNKLFEIEKIKRPLSPIPQSGIDKPDRNKKL